MPTPEEILTGLYKWLCNQLRKKQSEQSENDQKVALTNQFRKFRDMIEQIKNSIELGDGTKFDSNQPLKMERKK